MGSRLVVLSQEKGAALLPVIGSEISKPLTEMRERLHLNQAVRCRLDTEFGVSDSLKIPRST